MEFQNLQIEGFFNMKYQDFLDYIYKRHSGNVKLGLDRMHNILKEMGSPNKKLNGIHIAGTNGKGSTAAMCEALSLEFDLKTGMNTSPHLVDYRERIRVNGKNISLETLIEVYQKWKTVLEKNEASFFEITTAMAFYHFMNIGVENAIFEVGLGGRLDGTNPFKSTVTAITSISYDHPKSLGDSVEKIAYEKAGIIKENTPIVIGKMDEKYAKIIKEVANKKNAPIFEFGKDFSINNIRIDKLGTTFDFQSSNFTFKNIITNLLGKHQANNASVALMSFLLFMKNKNINKDKIYLGLNKVNWQGRMQIISQKPTVIIDGAHNEEGIKILTKNLKKLFPNQKIRFVLAILRDKKLATIIKDICEISDKIYLTKNSSKRAAEIDVQAKFVKKHNAPFELFANVKSASEQAIQDSELTDVVIISGSLYTIAEILSKS